MSGEFQAIRYEKHEGGIVLITIDNSRSENCIDERVHEDLCRAWLAFRADPELNVAVLTGAGEKSFCAGWDIKGYAKQTKGQKLEALRNRASFGPGLGGLTRGIDVFKPIVAAINGYCLAGGMEIAMACDIRIGAAEAEFGVLNRRWDIGCESGLTQRLPHIVGLGNALDLIISGRKFDAEEAHRIGFLNRVVPRESVVSAAMEYARGIAALPQTSIRADKESVLRGLGRSLSDGLWMENTLWNTTVHSEDLEQGIERFASRRAN
ncbi:enoyl-CoA hydratase/isomerase family protein [Cupriavidus sp. LEh25]|nr:enoyl-CoA hydratase/isomerase family protein [Cupriavidus sp. LEh21]MBP0621167.1 enoyl-CoA hydratase/isomerase family protein [Cupriavidus sp. LEh25]